MTRPSYDLALRVRRAQQHILIRKMFGLDWLEDSLRARELGRIQKQIFNLVMEGWL